MIWLVFSPRVSTSQSYTIYPSVRRSRYQHSLSPFGDVKGAGSAERGTGRPRTFVLYLFSSLLGDRLTSVKSVKCVLKIQHGS